MEELRQTFLPRIDENRQAVDAYEARKEEIVARKLEDLERLRSLREARQGEIESKRTKISLLREQLEDRRAQLGATEDGDPLRSGLEDEIVELEREVERESAELAEQEDEDLRAAEEIRRLEGADEEAIFLEEMQPVYREGIDLHLGFYRGVIALAREQLTPEEAPEEAQPSSALIDHINARISERDRLRGQPLAPEAFATLRREFELDQRMSQAWLSALILEVRFALNEYRLETIADEEREELELLAESIVETWTKNPRLEMYVDGHADSKQFRGETPCVSATKNVELSRLRAEAVRGFFADKLGTERVFLDWFGNFSPQSPGTGTGTAGLGDRRIEIRIASRRTSGFDSHREYFAMLHGLELAGRTFVRQERQWVQEECVEESAQEVEYLSEAYHDLAERLGLVQAAGVPLRASGGALEVRLGNAFIVADGDRGCVAVRPCADPSP